MKGILQITTMVIRNLEKIPVKDFILSGCKLKTCNCTKLDTFTSIFKIFGCNCIAATRQSNFLKDIYFCRTPLCG